MVLYGAMAPAWARTCLASRYCLELDEGLGEAVHGLDVGV